MIFVWIEVTRDDSSVTEPESNKFGKISFLISSITNLLPDRAC